MTVLLFELRSHLSYDTDRPSAYNDLRTNGHTIGTAGVAGSRQAAHALNEISMVSI
jgi:hypothetical protein